MVLGQIVDEDLSDAKFVDGPNLFVLVHIGVQPQDVEVDIDSQD